jgi:hypothetical protein
VALSGSTTVGDTAPASSGGGGGSIESLTLARLLSSLMMNIRRTRALRRAA